MCWCFRSGEEGLEFSFFNERNRGITAVEKLVGVMLRDAGDAIAKPTETRDWNRRATKGPFQPLPQGIGQAFLRANVFQEARCSDRGL